MYVEGGSFFMIKVPVISDPGIFSRCGTFYRWHPGLHGTSKIQDTNNHHNYSKSLKFFGWGIIKDP